MYKKNGKTSEMGHHLLYMRTNNQEKERKRKTSLFLEREREHKNHPLFHFFKSYQIPK